MDEPPPAGITPDTELSEKDIGRLLAHGRFTGQQRARVSSFSREAGESSKWAGIWSGGIGATLILLGLLFFFASNWKEMSPTVRLWFLQGTVALCAVSACITGIRSSIGKWLLVAGTVLLGVLLAVFGQTFQTGADSFEVFALWAGLSLVWVVLSCNRSLWLLWFAVAQTALALYNGQVLVPNETIPEETGFLLLGLFSVASLGIWEWVSTKDRFSWFHGNWIRVLLVTVAATWLSFCPLYWIFEFNHSRDPIGWAVFGSLVWLLAVGFGVWFYQAKKFSVGAMSVSLFSIGIIAVCGIARVLIEIEDDSAGIYLFIGLISVAIFSAIAALIIRVSRSHNNSTPSSSEA